jgi:hypothetical protein
MRNGKISRDPQFQHKSVLWFPSLRVPTPSTYPSLIVSPRGRKSPPIPVPPPGPNRSERTFQQIRCSFSKGTELDRCGRRFLRDQILGLWSEYTWKLSWGEYTLGTEKQNQNGSRVLVRKNTLGIFSCYKSAAVPENLTRSWNKQHPVGCRVRRLTQHEFRLIAKAAAIRLIQLAGKDGIRILQSAIPEAIERGDAESLRLALRDAEIQTLGLADLS